MAQLATPDAVALILATRDDGVCLTLRLTMPTAASVTGWSAESIPAGAVTVVGPWRLQPLPTSSAVEGSDELLIVHPTWRTSSLLHPFSYWGNDGRAGR